MGILGFFFARPVNASDTGNRLSIVSIITDTSGVNDTTVKQERPLYDPKQDFKNLFTTAITGDGVNGARLNPMAVSFVQGYIARNRKGFLQMKEWAKPYFNMMDEVLAQHGLPKELKYLAVIESGLKYNANSFAGAVGPWAFMPAAAREYGLKMTRYNDERLDYYKSTHAAARLLTNLYQRYGDWLLVIAAYNCGAGNVDKAIKRSGGSRDFWTLQYHLPDESMNHVKKFIGTHYIFEEEGGVTTVTKAEMKDLLINGNATQLKEDDLKNTTSYTISGRFRSEVILKYIDLDKAIFDRYNPGFDNKISIDGKYELRLPNAKMNIFVEKRYEILDESMKILVNGATGPR